MALSQSPAANEWRLLGENQRLARLTQSGWIYDGCIETRWLCVEQTIGQSRRHLVNEVGCIYSECKMDACFRAKALTIVHRVCKRALNERVNLEKRCLDRANTCVVLAQMRNEG